MSNLIFCLMGPTASGKTDLACSIVQDFPLEIISVDSAMIYREMNIGTAKPEPAILARAPHHLIDILDPQESYSAAQFCTDVQRLSTDIYARGKIPLLVGGSMMYFRALQQGLSTLPASDPSLRAKLLQRLEHEGLATLYDELIKIDAPMQERIHPNDTQRTLRALEIYYLSHECPSKLYAAQVNTKYRFVNLALMPESRSWLHERIAIRFKEMLRQGLVEEVVSLVEQWSLSETCPSMRSVGYRQVLLYLQGAYNQSDLCEKGIAATRQLAKRQLTWLRHWQELNVLPAEDSVLVNRHKVVALIQQILDNDALL